MGCRHLKKKHVCHNHGTYKLVEKKHLEETMWLNSYVVGHYRPQDMSVTMCAKSAFHLTNETVNIWSHLLGFLYFSHQQYQVNFKVLPSLGSHTADHAVLTASLFGMQMCMLLSACYHVFGCTSPEQRRQWLKMDIFGISAGLLGMYLCGIYTAFFCFEEHMSSYFCVWLGIFMITAYVPTRQDFFERKIIGSRVGLLHMVYCMVIAFGICPTIHWVFLHGGFDSHHVSKWFPSVVVLYSMIATAFLFYVSMFPERVWPGKFDVIGCSHQWWHLFILAAMVYWQNAGIDLLRHYRSDDSVCLLNRNYSYIQTIQYPSNISQLH